MCVCARARVCVGKNRGEGRSLRGIARLREGEDEKCECFCSDLALSISRSLSLLLSAPVSVSGPFHLENFGCLLLPFSLHILHDTLHRELPLLDACTRLIEARVISARNGA